MGIGLYRLDLLGIHQDARWRGFDPSFQDGSFERQLYRGTIEAALQYPIHKQERTSRARIVD